jgi:S1-C subfamily serine protease
MRRAKPGNQRPKRVRPPGAVVLEVDPQSAAERAGLKPGDLMTELDGTPARDAADLRLVTRSWYSCVDPPYGFE